MFVFIKHVKKEESDLNNTMSNTHTHTQLGVFAVAVSVALSSGQSEMSHSLTYVCTCVQRDGVDD